MKKDVFRAFTSIVTSAKNIGTLRRSLDISGSNSQAKQTSGYGDMKIDIFTVITVIMTKTEEQVGSLGHNAQVG
jgi:hypothetical protein